MIDWLGTMEEARWRARAGEGVSYPIYQVETVQGERVSGARLEFEDWGRKRKENN